MDDAPQAKVCALASGSSGNCAVLRYECDRRPYTVLLDAGLSPRKTKNLLEQVGIGLHEIDAVILTHLDSDHWHAGWATGWPRSMRKDTRLLLHRAHVRRAERSGTLFARPTPFEDQLDLPGGASATSCMLAHDEEGVAAYRIELPGGSFLGWVTDAGAISDQLVEHLVGVHVLGIESNYCPRLQAASGRPDFLIQRVTGDAGHLSNQQCLDAVERIGPREHVLLLHLSRDCNQASVVADLHAGADYALTIAPRHFPSRWVRVGERWSAQLPSGMAT